MTDLHDRIAELEQRLGLLEARAQLVDEADDLLERAVRDRLPLERALDEMMPLLESHSGAKAVLVHTLDENLERRLFVHGVERFPISVERILERTERGELFLDLAEERTIVGQRLDVAGESFGCVALCFEAELGQNARQVAAALMRGWSEELDNYLAAIARARHKAVVTRELSEALKEPVLGLGIDRAIAVLRDHVPFEDLLLVYRHDDDPHGRSLHYKIIQEGRLTHDSWSAGDEAVDAFLRNEANALVHAGSKDLLERFGIVKYREEVLISGADADQVVGRLILTTLRGEFNTYDRDLLQAFADFLQRRLVDFNKEWKALSLCFPSETVDRLLRAPDYRVRHLAPRDREVAILYCDIAGFTRISEKVLVEPALIGRLIDEWSRAVVEVVWESGGAFDKMVGDCIIGLWGPPFFELDAKECSRRAARAAKRIVLLTREIGSRPGLEAIRDLDPPIGVATALNYCPLYVGLFGPNEDYTGFSSGMNNTARLQGVADRDEILCMDRFVSAYDDDDAFEEEWRTARVKNVAEELHFRRLL